VLGRELSEGSTIVVDRRADATEDETKVDIRIVEGPPVPAVVGGGEEAAPEGSDEPDAGDEPPPA
jgi:hypothetical protein